MKRILLTIWVGLYLPNWLAAQTPIGYEQYRPADMSATTTYFFDDFADNSHHWDLSIDSRFSVHTIVQDAYYLESKDAEDYDSYGRFATQLLPAINDSLDFEIEANIKLVKGSNFAEYGLLWGRSLCCEHNFNLSADAYFSVGEFKFEWSYIVSPTPSNHIYRREGYNRMTVRKADTTFYFFVNKHLVATMPARPLFGSKFGFWVSNGAAIQVDYFSITYLPTLSAAPLLAYTEQGAVLSPPAAFVLPPPASLPDPPAEAYHSRPIPELLEGRKVLSGKETILSDTQVKLQLWDDGELDGDVVSLYFNGSWILQNHELSKQVCQIPLTLDPNGDNYLVLYINSEGSRPTNTLALLLDDGIRQRRLLLSADRRSCQAVRLLPPP